MDAMDIREGASIGPWVLRARVGRGGFGEVWTAEHREWPGKVDAFKFPLGEPALRRLRDEAATLRSLEHRNIVQVHDVDTQGPVPYIRMEYVRGGSLEDRLQREGRLPPGEAAHILEQALEGLAYAHGRGIVHRDLKPANILLAEDGTVKVSDFGLAVSAAEEDLGLKGSLDSKASDSKRGAGTPDYMAPEQKSGAPPTLDADVYSLGVVTYRMLAGAHPASLQPPSHFNPDVPARLDRIVARMLDPSGERYSDAAAALEDVKSMRSGTGGGRGDGGAGKNSTPVGEVVFAASAAALAASICLSRVLTPVPAAAVVIVLMALTIAASKLSSMPISSALFWGGVTATVTGPELHRSMFLVGVASAIAGAAMAAGQLILKAQKSGPK